MTQSQEEAQEQGARVDQGQQGGSLCLLVMIDHMATEAIVIVFWTMDLDEQPQHIARHLYGSMTQEKQCTTNVQNLGLVSSCEDIPAIHPSKVAATQEAAELATTT